VVEALEKKKQNELDSVCIREEKEKEERKRGRGGEEMRCGSRRGEDVGETIYLCFFF
jgi:hypothetical protein